MAILLHFMLIENLIQVLVYPIWLASLILIIILIEISITAPSMVQEMDFKFFKLSILVVSGTTIIFL